MRRGGLHWDWRTLGPPPYPCTLCGFRRTRAGLARNLPSIILETGSVLRTPGACRTGMAGRGGVPSLAVHCATRRPAAKRRRRTRTEVQGGENIAYLASGARPGERGSAGSIVGSWHSDRRHGSSGRQGRLRVYDYAAEPDRHPGRPNGGLRRACLDARAVQPAGP